MLDIAVRLPACVELHRAGWSVSGVARSLYLLSSHHRCVRAADKALHPASEARARAVPGAASSLDTASTEGRTASTGVTARSHGRRRPARTGRERRRTGTRERAARRTGTGTRRAASQDPQEGQAGESSGTPHRRERQSRDGERH